MPCLTMKRLFEAACKRGSIEKQRSIDLNLKTAKRDWHCNIPRDTDQGMFVSLTSSPKNESYGSFSCVPFKAVLRAMFALKRGLPQESLFEHK